MNNSAMSKVERELLAIVLDRPSRSILISLAQDKKALDQIVTDSGLAAGAAKSCLSRLCSFGLIKKSSDENEFKLDCEFIRKLIGELYQ